MSTSSTTGASGPAGRRDPVRRPALLASAAAVVVGAAVVTIVLSALSPHLPRVLSNYAGWQSSAYRDVGSFSRWFLGDMTEAEFYKTALGGVGLLTGGALAHLAWRRRSRFAGFPISYGTGLWPWIATSATIGLLGSDVVWGWTLPVTGSYQPTFVPFVSVPPAVVLVYGAGWTVALTGAGLGIVLTTPISLLVVNYFCTPLHLPSVIGNVTGMWAGALIAFWLCRHLRWMPPPSTAQGGDTGQEDATEADRVATELGHQGPAWVARRVLADFTEAQFYGTELASAGLLGGTLLAFLLNPSLPSYGTGLWPAVLFAQVLTATIGVLLWRHHWAKAGWFPTFVPVVSVAPAAVLAFGATPQAVIAGAVLGAVFGPPVAAWVASKLPADFHPYIGNVVSMAVCTLVIIPTLALLPGFPALGSTG